MTATEQLVQALEGGKRLFVFMHDNPDPDAIAAAWLMGRIGEHLGLEPYLVHGGSLARAENRAMVRVLNIPVQPLEQLAPTYGPTDRFALVDTRPGTGNNSFPHEELSAHVVVDHHGPPLRLADVPFVDVRQDQGCSATLVLEHLDALGLELDGAMATAVLYAIISETQDLDREASRADRDAYQRLVSVAQLANLGSIRHPPRDRAYYRTVGCAMRQVLVGKNTCVCHVGRVPYPEVVAEMADFLVAMQQISWCLVSGLHGQRVVLSIRTTTQNGRPERVMRRLLGRRGSGGGHGQIAGGAMPNCGGLEDYGAITERLTERFLELLERRVPERLRPLLTGEACGEEEGRTAAREGANAAEEPGDARQPGD